jgi:hypothetical protein
MRGDGRRRRGLRAGLAIAAAVAALSVGATSAQAGEYFSPTGPWNAPIPANPTLDPNSGPIVSTMTSTINSLAAQQVPPNVNTDKSSVPIYYANSSTPKQPITIDGNQNHHTVLRREINEEGGVPFPAGAQPAPGTDGHIVVYDTSSKKMYEFWRASSPKMNGLSCLFLPWTDNRPCYRDSRWHADWGGMMDEVDVDPGVFTPNAWPGVGTDGYGWGASATSLPLLGGLITFEDLNAGVIDHAVAAAFGNVCTNYFMGPAQREDGDDASPNCLPEGARLQLDPSYNVDADSNPPFTKAVERAAQKYGIIVRDKTGVGGSLAIFGQDPQTQPSNPYTSGPGIGGTNNGGRGYFGGTRPYELLRNFPWHRLRVISAPHCTTAPCGW